MFQLALRPSKLSQGTSSEHLCPSLLTDQPDKYTIFTVLG